ncbi:MAG: hypothetical protein GQ542_19685 [Desulforhopalus sp.]|nr:hypothetical protein [Desulforhopalus sp.]
MNIFEKIYSLLAIIFAAGVITCLIYFPQLRQLDRLIPICLLGLVTNIGLMFIVLRDIYSRQFRDQGRKYFWMALVLLFWPSILFYLPRYGFRPRVI